MQNLHESCSSRRASMHVYKIPKMCSINYQCSPFILQAEKKQGWSLQTWFTGFTYKYKAKNERFGCWAEDLSIIWKNGSVCMRTERNTIPSSPLTLEPLRNVSKYLWCKSRKLFCESFVILNMHYGYANDIVIAFNFTTVDSQVKVLLQPCILFSLLITKWHH